MRKTRAAATLMVLSPILAELVSGSTPPHVFFAPATLALFLLLGYGLPVLLIREFVIRQGLDQRAIFLLGLGYGVFNEGLLAKTMIFQRNLPIHEFDNYGYLLGISIPWSVTISVWHALSAVLFPILFTYKLFPVESRTPWLGKKITIVLAVLTLGTAFVSFMGKSRVAGTLPEAGIFLGTILACIAVASRLVPARGDQAIQGSKTWLPLLFGLSTLLAYALLTRLAAAKPPLVVFFLGLIAVLFAYRVFFSKAGWHGNGPLIAFGIGCYMQSALLGMIARLMQRVGLETLVFGLFTEVALLSAAIRMQRASSKVRVAIP